MNPSSALAYHNAQLEASAFREEFDPEAFEDLTEPKYDMIHKVGTRPAPPFETRIHVIGKTALPSHPTGWNLSQSLGAFDCLEGRPAD